MLLGDEEVCAAVSDRDNIIVHHSEASYSWQDQVLESFSSSSTSPQEEDAGAAKDSLTMSSPKSDLSVVLIVCRHRKDIIFYSEIIDINLD